MKNHLQIRLPWLLADEVHRRWHNNTTKDLKRVGKKCRMFYITRKQDARGDGWDVEEEKPDNIPVVLTKNINCSYF